MNVHKSSRRHAAVSSHLLLAGLVLIGICSQHLSAQAQGNNSVSVSSPTALPTLSVVDTISVPTADRIQISPDSTNLYVSGLIEQKGTISGAVTVINTTTLQVTATIPLPLPVFSTQLTPDGKSLYVGVAMYSSDGVIAGQIYVIDTATNAITASIFLGGFPRSLTFTPDGTKLYVPNYNLGIIQIIDTATNQLEKKSIWMGQPLGVLFTPDGQDFYVGKTLPRCVSLRTASGKLVERNIGGRTIAQEGAEPVALIQSRNLLYLAGSGYDYVYAIDTSSNTVIASILCPIAGEGNFSSVSLTPDNKYLFLAIGGRGGYGQIMRVKTATNQVVGDNLRVGGDPVVVVAPNGHYAYTANSYDNTVSVIQISQ